MQDKINVSADRTSEEKKGTAARILTGSDSKWQYLNNPTMADRILEWTVLPFIPSNITPNQITAFRFLTIPIILTLLLLEMYPAATILFVISAFSDAVDGAMARTQDKITAKGIVMDPLTDKILIGLVAIVLVTKYISSLLAFLIVFLELALIASIYFRYQEKVVPAKLVGKIKMILQSMGLVLLLIYINTDMASLLLAAQYILYTSVFFAFLSLFVYKSV